MTVAIGVLGVTCGLVGCLPTTYLFEGNLRMGKRVSVGIGIIAVILSFTLLTGALAIARVVLGNDIVGFGVSMLVAYLVVWVVETARAWQHRIVRR